MRHDSIVRIHPNDGGLERPRDVIHLNDMSNLLIRIDLRLHNMELEDALDARVR